MIDSVPGDDGAAGIVGFNVFPTPDSVLPEGVLPAGAVLPGANVDGGPDIVGEDDVDVDIEEDGAVGIDVVVCMVGAAIIVDTVGTTKSRPVQGSIGTFITMVRGVR